MAWRFVAHDLRTNAYLGDVPARGATWTEGENAVSSLEFTVDLAEGGGVYREMLRPGRAKVTPLRDGNPLAGSQIVWDRNYDGRMMRVQCAGMWSYFAQRRLTATKTYRVADGDDQLDIARDLIAWAQQAQGDIGLLLDATTSGVLRDRSYPGFEEQPIAALVDNLADVIGGFEFAVTTAMVNDAPVSTWRAFYPRRGRTAVQSQLRFELGQNLGRYTLAETAPVTTMRGVGAGEGDTMLRASAPQSDLLTAGWPLLEQSRSRKDVSVQATLDSHAQADLRNTNADAERLTLELVSPDDPMTPLGAWQIGDDARIVIPAGVDWLWPEGRETTKRIVGQRVVVSDDGGMDRVTLTMGAPLV